jgi:protein-disulfide isomerase
MNTSSRSVPHRGGASLDPVSEGVLPTVDPRIDHIAGAADAEVVVIEYGDFECPYCGAAYPELKRLQHAMGKRLALVFRHFPLMQLHPLAWAAARFAQAAATIGRFWQMHDMLFEHQDALDRRDLISYGRSVGMDPRLIEDALQERFTADVIRDLESGLRSGVSGTPSLFINGARHDGEARFDALMIAIERTLKGERP